eukprot:TRINITY_DN18333_c0_g1_i1.p1 TRINITY_DN18333_c0_g1~~TRINITY_DN18333_c0_g1_i1.p1  ORF type:complete len:401 (+),score=130.14 TRINITY_DN18333_c0_g1_i1:79-1281(+)
MNPNANPYSSDANMFVGAPTPSATTGAAADEDDLFAGMNETAQYAPPPQQQAPAFDDDNIFGNAPTQPQAQPEREAPAFESPPSAAQAAQPLAPASYDPPTWDNQGFFQGPSERVDAPAEHVDAAPTPGPIDPTSTPPQEGLDQTTRSQDSAQEQAVQESGNFFKMAYYQKFFNVDTADVVERLRWSAFLVTPRYMKPRAERDVGNSRPDMYGPLWVSTTLWVVMAVCDVLAENVSRYRDSNKTAPATLVPLTASPEVTTASPSSGNDWEFDFEYVVLTLATSYAYVLGVPLLLWCILRYKDVGNISLSKLICLYGYAMSPMVIGAVVTIVPVMLVKLLAIGITSLYSFVGIVMQLRQPTSAFSLHWKVGFNAFLFVCHGVATLLIFFEIIALGNKYDTK